MRHYAKVLLAKLKTYLLPQSLQKRHYLFITGLLSSSGTSPPELTLQPTIQASSFRLWLFLNWAPGHEGVLGSGDIAPCILDLGTRWRWVVSFMPQPLYPQGKSPWYPLDRRLGGAQGQSGHSSEDKNSQPLPELNPLIIQPAAQCCTTELSRLLRLYHFPYYVQCP
jgi:hypothetical protein